TGAEGTLKVVEIDRYHLGILVATSGTTANIDFLHHFGVRVLVKVELGHSNQCFTVLRKQEVVILLLRTTLEGNGQSVVIRKFTRLERTQADLHIRGNAVIGPHLPLNPLGNFGWRRLGSATQANQQVHKSGTSEERH